MYVKRKCVSILKESFYLCWLLNENSSCSIKFTYVFRINMYIVQCTETRRSLV